MTGGQLQAEGWLADMEVEKEKAQSDWSLRGEECCKPRQGTHRKRAFEITVTSVGEFEEIIFPLKERGNDQELLSGSEKKRLHSRTTESHPWGEHHAKG